MSTGTEKVQGNSLLVLKNKVLEIFTKSKLCVWVLHYRTIKQNKTPSSGYYSQEVHWPMIKIKIEVTVIQDRVNK